MGFQDGAASQDGRNDAENQGNLPEDGQPAPENRQTAGRISFNPLALFRPLARNFSAGGSRTVDERDPFHYEAARFADSIVKQSNPDYDATSRSAFLRAKGAMSLLNMFSSATNLFASRSRFLHMAQEKGLFTWKQNLRENLFSYVLPGLGMALFYTLAQGRADDDPEELAGYTARLVAESFFMKIPLASGVAAGVIGSVFDGKPGYGRNGLRTVYDEPIRLARNAVQSFAIPAWQKMTGNRRLTSEQKKNMALSLLDAASFASRFPAGRMLRNIYRAEEQERQGKSGPLSHVMPR